MEPTTADEDGGDVQIERQMAVVVAVVVLALAGCGSGKNYSASDVINAFREQTGHHLVRDSKSSSDEIDALEFDDADPNYEWGTWTIDVTKSPSAAAGLTEHTPISINEATLDPSSVKVGQATPIKPDADGIYWDHEATPSPGFWTATKRYGKNVYLVYIGGRTKGHLGSKFDRVDTALRSLNGK